MALQAAPAIRRRRRYLSRAARPFLPELIRGYAVYVWLDADTWVQQPLGLRWLIDATKGEDLAAVPTIHPAYKFTDRDRSWLYKRYRMAFGDSLARELSSDLMLTRASSPRARAPGSGIATRRASRPRSTVGTDPSSPIKQSSTRQSATTCLPCSRSRPKRTGSATLGRRSGMQRRAFSSSL